MSIYVEEDELTGPPALPPTWDSTREVATLGLWESELQASILEAYPGNEPFEFMRKQSKSPGGDRSCEQVFGMTPDIEAACKTACMSIPVFEEFTAVSSRVVKAVELGAVSLTLRGVVHICGSLGWPLAVLFRDELGRLNPVTRQRQLESLQQTLVSQNRDRAQP